MTDDSKKADANPPSSSQGGVPAVALVPAVASGIVEYEIHSLEDYIGVTQKWIDGWNNPLCFRGDSDASRSLMPSIFRLLGDSPTPEEIQTCREHEFQANHRFLHHAKAIDGNFPDDKDRVSHRVSQLVVMRHHGLHSRLLDWTASPLVALLFAVVKGGLESKSKSCVWALAPVKLNQKFGI